MVAIPGVTRGGIGGVAVPGVTREIIVDVGVETRGIDCWPEETLSSWANAKWNLLHQCCGHWCRQLIHAFATAAECKYSVHYSRFFEEGLKVQVRKVS